MVINRAGTILREKTHTWSLRPITLLRLSILPLHDSLPVGCCNYCIVYTAGWRKLHLPHGLRSLVPGSMRKCLTSLRHGALPPTVTSPTDLSPPWCAPASCRLARSVPCCVARPSPPRRPPRAPQSPVRTQSDAIRDAARRIARNHTQSYAIIRNHTQSYAINGSAASPGRRSTGRSSSHRRACPAQGAIECQKHSEALRRTQEPTVLSTVLTCSQKARST